MLDDITTSGSSLEAAKRLLAEDGTDERGVIKIAAAKTMLDEGDYTKFLKRQ